MSELTEEDGALHLIAKATLIRIVDQDCGGNQHEAALAMGTDKSTINRAVNLGKGFNKLDKWTERFRHSGRWPPSLFGATKMTSTMQQILAAASKLHPATQKDVLTDLEHRVAAQTRATKLTPAEARLVERHRNMDSRAQNILDATADTLTTT